MIRFLITSFFIFSCAEQDNLLNQKPESQNKKLDFSILSKNLDFQADHQSDPPHFSGVGKVRFNQKLKLYNFSKNVFYILLSNSFAYPEKGKDLAEDKVVLHLFGDENLDNSSELIITPMFDCDKNPHLNKSSEVSKLKNKKSLTYSKEESFQLKDSVKKQKEEKSNCKPVLQIVFLDENKEPASFFGTKLLSLPTDSSKGTLVLRFSVRKFYSSFFDITDTSQLKDQYHLESLSDLEKSFEKKKELIEEDKKDEIKKMQAREKRKGPPNLLTPHQLEGDHTLAISVFSQSDLKDEAYVDLFSHEGNFKCIRKGHSQFEEMQSYLFDTQCGTIYNNHYLGRLVFTQKNVKNLYWGLSLSGTATIVNRVDLQYEYDAIERDKRAYALELGQIQETKNHEKQLAAAHMTPDKDSYKKGFTEELKVKYLLGKEWLNEKVCEKDAFFNFLCTKQQKRNPRKSTREENKSKALYIDNPDEEEE